LVDWAIGKVLNEHLVVSWADETLRLHIQQMEHIPKGEVYAQLFRNLRKDFNETQIVCLKVNAGQYFLYFILEASWTFFYYLLFLQRSDKDSPIFAEYSFQ